MAKGSCQIYFKAQQWHRYNKNLLHASKVGSRNNDRQKRKIPIFRGYAVQAWLARPKKSGSSALRIDFRFIVE